MTTHDSSNTFYNTHALIIIARLECAVNFISRLFGPGKVWGELARPTAGAAGHGSSSTHTLPGPNSLVMKITAHSSLAIIIKACMLNPMVVLVGDSCCWSCCRGQESAAGTKRRSHVETLVTCKLGINQNYYTFTLILLIKIVPCNKFR